MKTALGTKRTLLRDEAGATTLAFYDAAGILFDNRLKAAEVREESYSFTMPESTPGSLLKLSATLYYVAYPDSFATRLSLPKAEPIRVAWTEVNLPPGQPAGTL